MRFTALLVRGFVCAGLLFTQTVSARLFTPRFSLSLDVPQQASQADEALKQGKQLLKRGHADQALGYLQTALQLYDAAKNKRGAASAHNELGDLYLRQGQDKIALDHYKKAYESLIGVLAQEQTNEAAAGNAARMAGSNAGVVAETAAGLSDTSFNANLLLAKIGDTNSRLGRQAEASAAYGQMRVKKPESVASRTTRRLEAWEECSVVSRAAKFDVAVPTSAVIGVLEAKKEFDLYRDSIVYSTYELGMGRINYFNNDLEGRQETLSKRIRGDRCKSRFRGEAGTDTTFSCRCTDGVS